MYELKITFNSEQELLAYLAGRQNTPQPEPQQPAQQITQPVEQPQQPQQPQQPVTPQQPAQTKTYTADELARAAAPLMDKPEGLQMLQELLAYYGVVSLMDLPKDQYADFAEKLRNLGVEV